MPFDEHLSNVIGPGVLVIGLFHPGVTYQSDREFSLQGSHMMMKTHLTTKLQQLFKWGAGLSVTET